MQRRHSPRPRLLAPESLPPDNRGCRLPLSRRRARFTAIPEMPVMKTFRFLALVALAALSLTTRAAAQQMPVPTKEHEALARDVGVWDGDSSMWTSADAPPLKSKGVETNRMLGGFWLVSSYEGDMLGQKFTGQMSLGYDPVKKKYVGVWVDSVSPHLQMLEGDWDEATRTMTLTMSGTDFATHQPMTANLTTRYLNDDAKVFEMYAPSEADPAKMQKVMEVKYQRRKK
jgi:hypothetical protein